MLQKYADFSVVCRLIYGLPIVKQAQVNLSSRFFEDAKRLVHPHNILQGFGEVTLAIW